MNDLISRQDVLKILSSKNAAWDAYDKVKLLPSAQLDPQEIGYWECSNALLKMWIDNVLTDGEYYRIADKLNTYWKDKIRGKKCGSGSMIQTVALMKWSATNAVIWKYTEEGGSDDND